MSDPSAKDPTSFNLPDRSILPEASTDRLGLALIALMREVWVVKDRMMTLEAVLDARGIDVAEAIEGFEPSEEFAGRLQAEGDAFVANVTSALSGEAP
ncbi:MAG: hypothetical protein AAGL10_05635 [Pseudomonadota bacterium]